MTVGEILRAKGVKAKTIGKNFKNLVLTGKQYKNHISRGRALMALPKVITYLRFDKYICIWDTEKKELNISIGIKDTNIVHDYGLEEKGYIR